MRAALVFSRDAGEERFELSEAAVVIGRGAECELRVGDDRVSTRHCRLWTQGDGWLIEDLRSTNRTFVNGEAVGEPRRLRHGDMVRLGARDARLFEARFVIHEASDEHRAAARAVAEGVQRELGDLRARLAERNDEVTRIGAMITRLQAQLVEADKASLAARRDAATLTAELEELRAQLAAERTEHAAARDATERAARRVAELEAAHDGEARKARDALANGERARSDLESRLRLATSDLAAAKASLATASENVRALKQAHDDALLRLQSLGEPAGPS